jgi:hypothetical protein
MHYGVPLQSSKKTLVEAVHYRDLKGISLVLNQIELFATGEDVLTAAKYIRQLILSADLIKGQRQDPEYWTLIHEAVETLREAVEKNTRSKRARL